jgi:hypothetical protein
MLSAAFPVAGLYRVEVSGWDKNHAFFVEKSDLEWTEDSGKRVVLSYAVQDRSVVFVRLLRQLSAERSHPVPYEAAPRLDPSLHSWRFLRVSPRDASQIGKSALQGASIRDRSTRLGTIVN